MQPTLGPEQGLGFVTLAEVEVAIDSEPSAAGAVAALLSRVLAALIPGVYNDDVRVDIRSRSAQGTLTAAVEINTRVFGERYTVGRTREVLVGSPSATLTALQEGLPSITDITLVGEVRAELRCLQNITCPVLQCDADELEYLSLYPSVRRCCAICVKRKFGLNVSGMSCFVAPLQVPICTETR